MAHAGRHDDDFVTAPETLVQRPTDPPGRPVARIPAVVRRSGRAIERNRPDRVEVEHPTFVGDSGAVVDDQFPGAQRRRPVDRTDRVAVAPRAHPVDVAVMVAAFGGDEAVVR